MKKKNAKSPKTAGRHHVNSLADLHAICARTITVEFNIDNESFSVECRRLLPKESAVLDDLRQAVLPPIEKGKTIDDDRPKYTDPNYVKQKSRINRVARALALYWAVPMFGTAKPGLTNQDEILQFVESQLNDDVLELLYSAVANGGVSLGELVNFTLPSSSPQS